MKAKVVLRRKFTSSSVSVGKKKLKVKDLGIYLKKLEKTPAR